MSLGLVSLVVMLIFMLLAQFGAIAVPLLAWIIWTAMSIILIYTSVRLPTINK